MGKSRRSRRSERSIKSKAGSDEGESDRGEKENTNRQCRRIYQRIENHKREGVK